MSLVARVIAVAGLSVVHDVGTMRYDDRAVGMAAVQRTYQCQQLQIRALDSEWLRMRWISYS